MKTVFIVLFLLISSISSTHELPTDREYTVAFSQDTLDNDFRFNQVIEIKNTLSKYPNIKFLYSDAKSNASIQVKQIEDFIEQKVDVLMVSAYDENTASIATSKAYRLGIPVVLVDRKVKGDEYTTYVHPDNRHIGEEAAKYIFKKMNYKGRVLLLKGVLTAEPTKNRTSGFYKVAKRYPNVEVIERTGNYLRRDAIIEVEKLLSSGERFDAIMSQSDSMLIGARMALSSHNIDPSSLITVGMDYIKPAQEAIRKGVQTSSFLYSLCAEESAHAVVDILAGKRVKKEILVETVQVTKDNVDNVTPIF